MDRVPVSSSDLKSVGYFDGVLEIEFNSGGIYQYINVPENIYTNLLDALSKGKFFHAYIRDKYRYIRIR